MFRFKRWLCSEWGQMALVILLVLAGRSSLADHYFVPSGSMEFTLMPGDRVIVNKTAYGVRIPFTKLDLIEVDRPQPGEIAVFDSPESGILLIKRIVAVEGDRVDLIDGQLWVNRKRLASALNADIEWFSARSAKLNLLHGGGPDIHGLVLPAGTVLMLGDHRGNSRDGRHFGLIDESELYGRAIRIYYSRPGGFNWRQL